MNILVLGGGAREHAICWSIKKSKECRELFCIPGNAGIREIAICEDINLKNKRELSKFCKEKVIELVIIGPEQYLEDGISDFLRSKKISVFGPSKKAAKLETSKTFAKKFLLKNNINTANYSEFKSYSTAKKFIKKSKFPLVIKADGLAAGKGVIICSNKKEALIGLDTLMKQKKFGKAGNKIIIEEYLDGFEISYFAFFDKNSFLKLGYALDHKRAFDENKGPNTGGMGSFSPSKIVSKKMEDQILKKIIKPTFKGLKNENLTYRGILFFGLMITRKGPFVIEYNVRFGDPECQTLLCNLKTDLLKIIKLNIHDRLSEIKIKNTKQNVITVVLASKGYPGKFKINSTLKNLSNASLIKGVEIFHGATTIKKGKVVSTGGRVLSITSKAKNLKTARIQAYKTIELIDWSNGFFRSDIGLKNS